MKKVHTISLEDITLNQISECLENDISLELSPEAINKINRCRDYLEKKLRETTGPIYGINTGFGSLYDRDISNENLGKLQENLIKSHACGTGKPIEKEIVQLMLYLKIKSLSYGHSGVRLETVNRLIDFFNNKIYPEVFTFGSLGASGDLAPLAHLSLPLIGLGNVYFENERYTGAEILKIMRWDALGFREKEGLALLNGTQFMSAFGCYCLIHAERLIRLANIIGALSLDSFDGRIEPFHPSVHKIRPQPGQSVVAAQVRDLLSDSQLIRLSKKHVQDPYSFRCIPQVHGACLDTFEFAKNIFLSEINGVSDNPNIFPDEDLIISAGNFHGEPLAFALDFLSIALAELGNISERRTFQLISGARGLPDYLVANPGLNSGLMIPQYTAAALVNRNKLLANPASTDSIVSSNGQEDHVSMGANAATKAYEIVQNLYSILAIELMTASQALEFRRPSRTSSYLEDWIHNFRKNVPFIDQDRVLHEDIEKSEAFLRKATI